jgi:hypothetical protein
VGAVDICFTEIDAAPTTEILREAAQQALEHTRFHPALEPPVTRLVGGIPTR